jgi:hypothetical protein
MRSDIFGLDFTREGGGGVSRLSIPNVRSDVFGLAFTREDSRLYTQHEVRYIWFGFYMWGLQTLYPT